MKLLCKPGNRSRGCVIRHSRLWLSAACVALAWQQGVCADWKKKPTHANIAYSKQYTRSKLDVWLPADAKTPCPLVVYFHGGGFKAGDKSRFARSPFLARHLKQNVAFAAVNYPFLSDAGYLAIMSHCGESIKFLKTKAKEWNVDPTRIAVMGGSAGAMISEHLTYWQDLGISACYAEQQPYRSWFLVGPMKKTSPPLILYTRSGPNDKVHNPDHARKLKAYCDSIGMKCELYGSRASGLPSLPPNTAIEDRVMQFFFEQWKNVKPDEK